jgi:hypothetical protein
MADFRLGRLKFNWRGAWAPSTAYVIDDIISFKGNTYVCVVNHTSAASETLWASTDLDIGTPRWQLHVPGIRIMGAWTPNTFYSKNDLISYGANQYICTVNHTSSGSETSFYSNDLSNWSLYVSGTRYLGLWATNTWYKLNDIVKYGNTLYLTTTAHTSSGVTIDETKFSVYLESVNFENTWQGFAPAGPGGQPPAVPATEYQPGDIVTYGGYVYIAKTINSDKQPNLYQSDWEIVTTGFRLLGPYDDSIVYVPGDVVQFGGNTYVRTVSGAAGIYPNIGTVWSLVTSGLAWRGPWDASSTYQINDVVSKQSASWVNLIGHNINIDPVEDQTISTEVKAWSTAGGTTLAGEADNTYTAVVTTTSGGGSGATFTVVRNNSGAISSITVVDKGTGYAASDTITISGAVIGGAAPADNVVLTLTAVGTGTGGLNWQALAQGESTLTLQDPGDILYRNNAGANVNLPIGPEGQILTVSSSGLPAWERNNLCANVFYVTTDGVDDPDYGKNISKPWRTLRYALSQIPTGNASSVNTIFVKSGSYEETLPLIIPEYTSIVGDNLRASIIKPNPTTQSLDPVPTENRFSTMFVLSESTTLKDLVFVGMEGFTPAAGDANSPDITQATIRGVFLRLNPATPILGKSPYITQCSAFSGRTAAQTNDANANGGVGALIDKSIYGQVTSNGSMLFDSFTQFHDGGVGFWCKDLGNAEIVSSFTYYCHIGYTCTGGGRIRSLAGNNSWGTYGAVSRGFDNTETPLTGNVRGQRLNFIYNENSALFKKLEQVVQGTDPADGNPIDYSPSNPNYALGLILYEQPEYLVVEPITGVFGNSKPISGIGSAEVTASGAAALTQSSAALAGLSGKIYTLTNLPVVNNQAVLPEITGSVKFGDIPGLPQYNDPNYYVIKEVVDAGTASTLNVSVTRQFDNPGTAADSVIISSVARDNNVATITTTTNHGLVTGDKVNIVISNSAQQTFATAAFTRTTVTVTSDTQFTYPNTGSNQSSTSLAVGNEASRVYKVSKSGGSIPASHPGGSDVALYNVSNTTILLDNAGATEIDASTTTIPVQSSSFTTQITPGVNSFLLINNELMQVVSFVGSNITVVRASEGTAASVHADGSVVYYVTKTAAKTTLRGDIGTAINQLPVFSISDIDNHDLLKVDNEFCRVNAQPAPQLVGQATIIFATPKTLEAGSNQGLEIRLRYSQVRLTGHDFLQIGTGGKEDTNWPNAPISPAAQTNEVVEAFPGRVYYVSTDQDGNFRVGAFFAVEQATGTATLDANAFNLSGLASLRLGTIGAQLGAAINEFSTDIELGGEFSRDTAAPTQLAVKTYVDNKVGGGIVRTSPTFTAQNLVSTGTTATFTTFTSNSVAAGDEVVISGANEAAYNGRFLVTAIDTEARSFSYTMQASAASPASGSAVGTRIQRMTTELQVDGDLRLRPTWNDASRNFNSLGIFVTDTTSGASSKVIHADVGGSAIFTVDKSGNAVFAGDLTVGGTTTTISSQDLSIADKTIIVGSGANDSSTANDTGLQVGSTGISLKYNHGTTAWKSSENIDLASGKGIYVNGVKVLDATSVLGLSVGAGGGIVTESASQTLTNKTMGATTFNNEIRVGSTPGPGTAGQFLISGGSDAAATWQTITLSTAAISSGSSNVTTVANSNVTVTTAGTLCATFNTSQNLVVAGTVTANSDAKLKKNVETISGALEKVSALRGVEFDYIASDRHQIGVIAQEVESVVPCVVESDEEGTKSVAYANLVALLIEAVKELKSEIETLKRG